MSIMSLAARTAAVSTFVAATIGAAAVGVAPASAYPADAAPRTVAVGKNPYGVAIDRRVGEAFVVNAHSVSVINLRSHRVVDTIQSAANPDDQTAIAVGAGGRRVYVGSFASPYMSVINAVTHKVIATSVLVGAGTVQIVATPTPMGPRLYLTQTQYNRIAEVDPSTLSVVRYIPLPYGPMAVAAAPSHRALWVGSENGPKIWVVRERAPKIIRTITARPSGPINGLTIGPNGRSALVAGAAGVALVRVPSGKVLHSWTTPEVFPGTGNVLMTDVALNPRGNVGYVLNSTFNGVKPARGAVRVVNTRTGDLGRVIRTGLTPQDLVLSGASNTGYVANWKARSVTMFRLRP